MALVQCPDCGAEVSDAAPACPRCGRPSAWQQPQPQWAPPPPQIIYQQAPPQQEDGKFLDPKANARSCLGCIAFCVIAPFVLFFGMLILGQCK